MSLYETARNVHPASLAFSSRRVIWKRRIHRVGDNGKVEMDWQFAFLARFWNEVRMYVTGLEDYLVMYWKENGHWILIDETAYHQQIERLKVDSYQQKEFELGD